VTEGLDLRGSGIGSFNCVGGEIVGFWERWLLLRLFVIMMAVP